jgi:GDPmannose 4,6-dehydratase
MAFKGAGIEVEFKGKVEQETAVVTAIHEITAVASTLADASLEAVTGLTSVDFAAKFSASGHSPASTLNALKVGQTVMRINPQFYRPAEVELLIGDPSHAKAKLGWAPTTSLEQLCQMMVEADLKRNAAGFAF